MKILFTLVLAISQWAMADESIQNLHITGEAFDPNNQTLLYREQHRIDGKQHTVSYSDENGNIFAEKKLSYEISFLTPIYQLHDQRFSRETGSEWKDHQWFVYRHEKSGTHSELLLNKLDNLVIDAGFNNFIRLHFGELESGKLLHFNFALTDPLTNLPMRIQSIDCRKYDPEQDAANHLCLRAITSNVLYRWFVPAIYVVYQRDTHLLMRYEGPSNLPNNNDAGQKVKINYTYHLTTAGLKP